MIRGILLVIITAKHIGGPISRITFQPMAFVSAAEGFIFLSGYVLGLLFEKRLLEGSEMSLATIMNKSLKIYSYHIATLFILMIPFLFDYSFLAKLQSSGLAPIFENPSIASTAYFLLLFQPEFFDILPMYILFIPIGLLILKGFSREQVVAVLGLSIVLWIYGQFQPSSFSSTPLLRSGFFNLFSWQLLFVLGCFFGFSRARGKVIIPRTRAILVCFLSLMVGFAVIRYKLVPDGTLVEFVRNFSDKQNLGIFRLINFLVIAYIIGFIIESGHFPKSRPLGFIGRHSLQVFVFQIILVYCYTPFRAEVYSMGPFHKLAVQFLAILLLFVPAFVHNYYLRHRRLSTPNASRGILVADELTRENFRFDTNNA